MALAMVSPGYAQEAGDEWTEPNVSIINKDDIFYYQLDEFTISNDIIANGEDSYHIKQLCLLDDFQLLHNNVNIIFNNNILSTCDIHGRLIQTVSRYFPFVDLIKLIENYYRNIISMRADMRNNDQFNMYIVTYWLIGIMDLDDDNRSDIIYSTSIFDYDYSLGGDLPILCIYLSKSNTFYIFENFTESHFGLNGYYTHDNTNFYIVNCYQYYEDPTVLIFHVENMQVMLDGKGYYTDNF